MKQKPIRKVYDTAFKKKAVELSYSRSNVAEVAQELGIRVSILYRWRNEHRKFVDESFPSKGILQQTLEQKRIRELEAKLKDVELERDILKKSIHILFKNS